MRRWAGSVEKVLCGAQAYFLRATGAVDAVRQGGATSIYAGSLCDLPSFAVKAFLAAVRRHNEAGGGFTVVSEMLPLDHVHEPVRVHVGLRSADRTGGCVLPRVALEKLRSFHYSPSPRHLEEISDVFDFLFFPWLCCIGIVVDHVQRSSHAVLVSPPAARITGPDAGRRGVRRRILLASAAPSLRQPLIAVASRQFAEQTSLVGLRCVKGGLKGSRF